MGITLREGFLEALKRQRIGVRYRELLVPGVPRWNRRALRHAQQWQDEVAASIRRRLEAGEPPSFELFEEELELRLGEEPVVPEQWMLFPPSSDEEEEQGVAAIPLPLGPAPGPQGAVVPAPAPAEREEEEREEEAPAAAPVPGPAPASPGPAPASPGPAPASPGGSADEAEAPPPKKARSGRLNPIHCPLSLKVSP